MSANEWLMLAIYVGTCVNVWLWYRLREDVRTRIEKAKEVTERWNTAAKEAEALWSYGAKAEAMQVLREASETGKAKGRAR